MKKYFTVLIFTLLILPLYLPLSTSHNSAVQQEPIASFVFETDGLGFAYPTGTTFIFGPRLIIWYCTSGTTTSYIPESLITGPHFCICVALVGIWQAPRIIQQPGVVSGMCLGLALIIPVE